MKYLLKLTFCLILTIVFSSTAINAQTEDWIRVQSDNGEFSIEVPAQYNFFTDKDGFSVSGSNHDLPLTEVKILNAFYDKTLISVESYRANSDALDTIREQENRDAKRSEIKINGSKIKQYIIQNKDSYVVKQYFNSKNNVYILTAASRTGETSTIKRFLGSLIFDPASKTPSDPKNVLFSQLKINMPELDTDQFPMPPTGNKPKQPVPEEKDVSKMLIVSKPFASYTEAARQKLTSGTITLRLTFTKDGWISRVSIMSGLPNGLNRQAVFAALRIKFLPHEKITSR